MRAPMKVPALSRTNGREHLDDKQAILFNRQTLDDREDIGRRHDGEPELQSQCLLIVRREEDGIAARTYAVSRGSRASL